MKRLLPPLAFVVLLLCLYFFTPLGKFFSRENFEVLKVWIGSHGSLAPAVYVLTYILASVLCLPGSVLTLMGGILFGLKWGIILVIVGANAGALVSAYIARKLGRDLVNRMLRGKLEILDQHISDRGLQMVIWLRLIPVMPYNILNYALGLSGITLPEIFLGNLLGMLPGIIAYVSLGNATTQISFKDPSVWTRPEVWGPFVLILVLSFLPKLLPKKKDY